MSQGAYCSFRIVQYLTMILALRCCLHHFVYFKCSLAILYTSFLTKSTHNHLPFVMHIFDSFAQCGQLSIQFFLLLAIAWCAIALYKQFYRTKFIQVETPHAFNFRSAHRTSVQRLLQATLFYHSKMFSVCMSLLFT